VHELLGKTSTGVIAGGKSLQLYQTECCFLAVGRYQWRWCCQRSLMHPPLAPHKHPDCADIIRKLEDCHVAHPVAKFWGACNDVKSELDRYAAPALKA